MILRSAFGFARPLLHALDPEQAHELTLKMLEAGLYLRAGGGVDPKLAVQVAGLDFPNPLGIAAGFDKDARVPDAMLDIGFGFAEIGTVTPRPQAGNPQPRIFRLPNDGAIINRLGFNNAGHAAALQRLQRRRARGIVGVNIGANKDATDRAADYEAGIATFADVASYFTVNISSPNTPGLRDLQAPELLDELLRRVLAKRDAMAASGTPRRPVFVKLAPDIAADDLPAIVERLTARKVDGIAISNTTITRDGLSNGPRNQEAGGLSGRPLFVRSTALLARVHLLTHGEMPLIGIGGLDSGEAAVAKVEAGASLLQLYTALVYEGPGLIEDIKAALLRRLRETGGTTLRDLTGRKAAEWAGRAA